jgi:hypothetical protein
MAAFVIGEAAFRRRQGAARFEKERAMKQLTRAIINCAALVLFATGIGICQCSTGDGSCGPWSGGDVFVAVGNGQTQVYHKGTGGYSKIHTLTYGAQGYFNDSHTFVPGDFTAGCSFDSHGNLYATNFSQSTVVEFDVNSPHAILQTIFTGGSSASTDNESVVFDAAGNFYVGHADSVSNEQVVRGGGKVEKYGPDNSQLPPLTGYPVAPDQRGSDWVELGSDGKTLFYASEGSHIKRFDLSTPTQLADFATLPSGGTAFALRLLPPFDGTGGLLVADNANILRLNGSGAVTKTYTGTAGESNWFALNLDTNGTSFWAGDGSTGHLYRFNIASGAVEVGPITTGGASTGGFLGGVCVVGQPGPVSTIPVTYRPGVNVEGHATFNSGDPKKVGFWQATDDAVLLPFTLGVARVQTSCSSLKPRLTKYFGADPRLPIPIPAVDKSCYYYHITAPADVDDGTHHTGGIHLNTGYVDPLIASLPPFFQVSPFGLCDVFGAAPRYLDAPSAPLDPLGTPNFDFTYDLTNLYNPFGIFPDPTLPGGPTPKHNDYVAVCRFPTGSATLNPPPVGTFHLGDTITFTARVRKNDGSIVTDAATPTNYMPLSIANFTSPPAVLVQALGVSDCSYVGQTTPPCTTAPFFVFHPETGNYTGPVTLTNPPFVPGTTYTACIDSFRNPTAYTNTIPNTTQPPPYFARRCTAFKVQ